MGEWEEDLPYSSPFFLWALQNERMIAAGVLSLLSILLIVYSFLLSLYFSPSFIQAVMRGFFPAPVCQ